MLKQISLVAMITVYFSAGIARFAKSDLYLQYVPSFIPHPKFMVLLSGLVEIILAFLLAFSLTRRGACYGILLLWSISLPINIYTVAAGGAGTQYTSLQLAMLIPFHLFLMLWAFWHIKTSEEGHAKVITGKI